MEGERPRVSEDVPSYKDLVQGKKSPKILTLPKGIKFEKKWFLRSFGYVFLVMFLIGIASYVYGYTLSPKVKYVVVDKWSDSWEIKPGDKWHQDWTVENPDLLWEINVTVRGGNNDLKIYIDTPSGRVDYGKLTSPIHIIVNVSRYGTGKYTIYWDNTFSLIASKYVSVKEALYVKTLDTTDKGFYEFIGFPLGFVGLVGFLAALGRRAIVEVGGDVIQIDYKSGWLRYYTELKVNGFKLDQKITEPIKFRVGENEDHVFELEPKGWLRETWVIRIDGQEVGRLP
ncbi:MAG: hypothetical protein H5T41_09415 [Methanomassiliicoccales archaeon]|nr:hypothetical protein [Methanomassiliicoccales archaeon]